MEILIWGSRPLLCAGIDPQAPIRQTPAAPHIFLPRPCISATDPASPVSLRIRDQPATARFLRIRAHTCLAVASAKAGHLNPFLQIRDSSYDLCYDNPHVEPRTQIAAPFFSGQAAGAVPV